jgi:hypothetical protein
VLKDGEEGKVGEGEGRMGKEREGGGRRGKERKSVEACGVVWAENAMVGVGVGGCGWWQEEEVGWKEKKRVSWKEQKRVKDKNK